MLCSLPFLVSKRCPPSNSDYKEDYGRPVSNRSTQAEARTPARTATCMRTSDALTAQCCVGSKWRRSVCTWKGSTIYCSSVGQETESLLPCVVQSRASAHNITGAGGGGGGGGKSLPAVAAPPPPPPHVHHAQGMLHH